jgi:hypothetical protein
MRWERSPVRLERGHILPLHFDKPSSVMTSDPFFHQSFKLDIVFNTNVSLGTAYRF